MVAFSKFVVAAPAAANQLFAAPAPRVAAPQARWEEMSFLGSECTRSFKATVTVVILVEVSNKRCDTSRLEFLSSRRQFNAA